jgi:hypothetical protein
MAARRLRDRENSRSQSGQRSGSVRERERESLRRGTAHGQSEMAGWEPPPGPQCCWFKAQERKRPDSPESNEAKKVPGPRPKRRATTV